MPPCWRSTSCSRRSAMRSRISGAMGDDVAPMTGCIADREQDGLVLALGFGQRRRAPGLPMHGVAAMLQQIRAGFFAQAVARSGHRHQLSLLCRADKTWVA